MSLRRRIFRVLLSMQSSAFQFSGCAPRLRDLQQQTCAATKPARGEDVANQWGTFYQRTLVDQSAQPSACDESDDQGLRAGRPRSSLGSVGSRQRVRGGRGADPRPGGRSDDSGPSATVVAEIEGEIVGTVIGSSSAAIGWVHRLILLPGLSEETAIADGLLARIEQLLAGASARRLGVLGHRQRAKP